MYEPIHTRQTADLEVAIWIEPDERLTRDGHDSLEKFWHPYLYQPRKDA